VFEFVLAVFKHALTATMTLRMHNRLCGCEQNVWKLTQAVVLMRATQL